MMLYLRVTEMSRHETFLESLTGQLSGVTDLNATRSHTRKHFYIEPCFPCFEKNHRAIPKTLRPDQAWRPRQQALR